jgi:hypothetical protein
MGSTPLSVWCRRPADGPMGPRLGRMRNSYKRPRARKALKAAPSNIRLCLQNDASVERDNSSEVLRSRRSAAPPKRALRQDGLAHGVALVLSFGPCAGVYSSPRWDSCSWPWDLRRRGSSRRRRSFRRGRADSSGRVGNRRTPPTSCLCSSLRRSSRSRSAAVRAAAARRRERV